MEVRGRLGRKKSGGLLQNYNTHPLLYLWFIGGIALLLLSSAVVAIDFNVLVAKIARPVLCTF
jgi:hypothetical protein